MPRKDAIVITGAAGYIGGQTALAFKDQGHTVIGIDIRPLPENLRTIGLDRFFQEDFSNLYSLQLLEDYRPRAIIHCAGTSLVAPSMTAPEMYYQNNFVKTKIMLDHLVKRNIRSRVIFSSSAAVYGEPVMTPCTEVDPTMPVSPYGESKLMIEMMLNAYHRSYGLDYIALRYFNACGADQRQRHGPAAQGTHIISRVLESIKNDKEFELYGTDYATPDGTCVRDYLDVQDIASAHLRAIDTGVAQGFYNLGTSTGTSNLEIINLAQTVTGREVRVKQCAPRAGDPAMLTASPQKWQQATAWQPTVDLESTIRNHWRWLDTVR